MKYLLLPQARTNQSQVAECDNSSGKSPLQAFRMETDTVELNSTSRRQETKYFNTSFPQIEEEKITLEEQKMLDRVEEPSII